MTRLMPRPLDTCLAPYLEGPRIRTRMMLLQPHRRRSFRIGLRAFVALALPACHGGDPGQVTEPGEAVAIGITAGSGQSGPAGQPLAHPIVARVTDAQGRGVANATVTFSTSEGSGSFAPASASTGESGEVSAVWTLGTHAGPLAASAAAKDLAPAGLVATAVAGAPTASSTLTATPDTVGTDEPSALTVVARDGFGNPVAGAAVELSATGPGNTIVQPSPTGEDGTTSGALSSSRPGTKIITVRIGGVTLERNASLVVRSPEVAEVRVTPGRAALLVDQSVELEAMVLDDRGEAVPEATITWATSDPEVAQVSGGGRVTAIAPGSATVTATAGPASAAAEVSVSLNAGTLTDVTYCTMDEVPLKMDVYIPDATKPRPLPVAVHVHGGGWTSGSKSSGNGFGQLMPLLLERGYLVASLDYRLAPAHKYPAQIQDLKCAIRHLRARASRYGLDPGRIGAWGGSAGGQLVSLLATADASAGFDAAGGFRVESSQVQVVATISDITDFTRPDELLDDYSRVFRTWPDPASPEMVEASPVTHVSADDAPFLLIAGEDDDLVLPAQSRRLHQRLLDAGVESSLLMVSNADHDLEPTDGPTDPSPAVINSRLVDFFDRHLR
jgi:acetyl esterase/lipase